MNLQDLGAFSVNRKINQYSFMEFMSSISQGKKSCLFSYLPRLSKQFVSATFYWIMVPTGYLSTHFCHIIKLWGTDEMNPKLIVQEDNVLVIQLTTVSNTFHFNNYFFTGNRTYSMSPCMWIRIQKSHIFGCTFERCSLCYETTNQTCSKNSDE